MTNVSRGTVGNIIAVKLLGDPTTHRHDEAIERFFFLRRVFIAIGQIHRCTKIRSTRNDRHFVQRMAMLKNHVEIRMTCFVPSRADFFLIAHRKTATLAAPAHFVASFFQLIKGDSCQIATSSEQSGFVDQVGEFCTRKSGSSFGDARKIHAGLKFDFFHVNAKDFLTTMHIGQRYRDLAVETTRTEQSGIENIGTVGRGDDDDTFLGVEAIHFDEHLVECLLALVIAAAHALTTVTPHSIDLINENQTWCIFLALLKHVAHTAGADTDEHFDEIRSRDREKRHVSFTSNGTSQEGFSGSRSTDHQNAFRNATTEFLELTRITKEFDDFLKLFFCLLDACDVFERDLILVHGQQASLAAAEIHCATTSRLHLLAEKENQYGDD